jgi:NMD protein affecting ribosome stability and mRNA decay
MQMLEGASADAYRPAGKPVRPVLCPDCKATFRRGRWRWGAAPAGAVRRQCPACLRIAQRYPAGYITLSGAFFDAHRQEILARVQHCETQEKGAHPLERVMDIKNAAGGTQVTTTSMHLARLIGHALEHAFKGQLSQSYSRGDDILRVRWNRVS